MRKLALRSTLLAAAVGLAAVTTADAQAKPPAKAAAAKAAPAKAGTKNPSDLKRPLKLNPTGLKFGMSQKEVVRLYNAVIENDYKKRLKEASPGVEMDRLRHTVNRKKDEFRLSYVEFDSRPAGLDDSPFRAEYAKENNEGYMRIARAGKERLLFFMKGRLWKVIDSYKLGETSKWGADYAQASDRLGKRLGVPGRKLAAAPEKGVMSEEHDWQDNQLHFRAINAGDGAERKVLALAYVDKGTEGRLASLRPAKKQKEEELDPAVKAVMRDTSGDPRVNPDALKDKKKK
jgi:hypothetical protein